MEEAFVRGDLRGDLWTHFICDQVQEAWCSWVVNGDLRKFQDSIEAVGFEGMSLKEPDLLGLMLIPAAFSSFTFRYEFQPLRATLLGTIALPWSLLLRRSRRWGPFSSLGLYVTSDGSASHPLIVKQWTFQSFASFNPLWILIPATTPEPRREVDSPSRTSPVVKSLHFDTQNSSPSTNHLWCSSEWNVARNTHPLVWSRPAFPYYIYIFLIAFLLYSNSSVLRFRLQSCCTKLQCTGHCLG